MFGERDVLEVVPPEEPETEAVLVGVTEALAPTPAKTGPLSPSYGHSRNNQFLKRREAKKMRRTSFSLAPIAIAAAIKLLNELVPD